MADALHPCALTAPVCLLKHPGHCLQAATARIVELQQAKQELEEQLEQVSHSGSSGVPSATAAATSGAVAAGARQQRGAFMWPACKSWPKGSKPACMSWWMRLANSRVWLLTASADDTGRVLVEPHVVSLFGIQWLLTESSA